MKERKLINLEEKQRLVNNNGNEKQVENENGTSVPKFYLFSFAITITWSAFLSRI